MHTGAKYYIEKLELVPHPEGGFFKEVYRADETITKESLPERYDGNRAYSTSIYFLLEGEQVSCLHRLKSDEVWNFYDGSSAKIYIIKPDGELEIKKIGNRLNEDESFQVVIKKNCWFGAELEDKSSFILTGCFVSPGFDFSDFEMGERGTLIKLYPQHSEFIKRLTSEEELR